MVNDVVYLVGCKLMQNGHRYGTIGKCSQESYGPVAAVASGQSHLVALLQAAILKENVQFFYFPGHVMILQRLALVICKCIKIPMIYDAFLY